MPITYKKIASVTVASPQAAIEFTSIPSTYTDLIILVSARVTRSAVSSTIVMQFNNSATSYSSRTLQGTGSAAESATGITTGISQIQTPAANATASTYSNALIYVPNYAGSTNKSVSIDNVGENNATEAYANLTAALWSNTAAITSIKFTEPNGSSNFAANSTAVLYGISKS